MGHGYFAVVGFGITVDTEDIYITKSDIKSFSKDYSDDKACLSDENDSDDNLSLSEKEIKCIIINKLKYLKNLDKYRRFSFEYPPDVTKLFITLKSKSCGIDVRGSHGEFRSINIEKMKPDKSEFELFYQLNYELTGEKNAKIKFGMFAYEDE